MKNIGGLFIYKIIHYFKHIATGVKAGKQKLVIIPLNKTVKQGAGKSHTNIILRNIMLKCRFIEFVDAEHKENIA